MKRAAPVEPRALDRARAAAYCGLSVGSFIARCPVRGAKVGARVIYDRRALDRWLDSLFGAAPQCAPDMEILRRLDGDARDAQGRA